jgi:hypothetical protein
VTRGTYLRPGAGTWLDDLRTFAARGWSDARVARELSALHAPRRFTRRVVLYYRHLDRLLVQECLPDEPRDPRGYDCREPPVPASEERTWARRAYQVRRGWGCLLPEVELRPREADLLAALRGHEPLGATLPELAAAVGVARRWPRTGRETWLSRLCRRGLVEVVGSIITGRGHPLPVYRLAEVLCPHGRARP